ncbi:hypothetical protein QTI51_32400 [Variovorax sp. J22G73]|uniref:hypothetical protein n=1 Tax=unclassified Variovorax TaxID=663243 RepID=UPI0025786442|nr:MULTISPECIES: hypothetical protein [unclassified Variovorax]MDM0009508.1 hypothetical protein [Variovorax sp. J22R203]MDM0102016.1 hypothetical protein [Variovorax sp. J22G73]
MTTTKNATPARDRGADPKAKAEGNAKAEAEQTAAPGETRWSKASGDGLQKPVLQQPNELDESASSQEAASASMEGVGRAAYNDAVTKQDTDRGPVMDAVYNGPVTEGHRVGDDEEVRGERDPMKSTSSRHP